MIYAPEAPWCRRCGEVLEQEPMDWSYVEHGWVCGRCVRTSDAPPPTQEELDELTDRRIAEFEKSFRRKPQEKS
jgi:recombinational DNA repair protein (RecF pathway)